MLLSTMFYLIQVISCSDVTFQCWMGGCVSHKVAIWIVRIGEEVVRLNSELYALALTIFEC